jgi:hypothetical protein
MVPINGDWNSYLRRFDWRIKSKQDLDIFISKRFLGRIRKNEDWKRRTRCLACCWSTMQLDNVFIWIVSLFVD